MNKSTNPADHSASSQGSHNDYEKAEVYEKDQEGPTNEFLSGEVGAIPQATLSGYHPTTEQKRLDRKINLKFDLVITVLLGWGFMMCGIDKSRSARCVYPAITLTLSRSQYVHQI